MQTLTTKNSVLVIVDVQEKLISFMSRESLLVNNLVRLIKSFAALKIPIILTEQYPEKLGNTIKDLATLLNSPTIISKKSFSCWPEKDFQNLVKSWNRPNIILAGIETHVCVYQTAMDLIGNSYNVHLVADAVSSRSDLNKEIAVQRMINEGVKLTSTEMSLFELLKIAEGTTFKEVLKIVK